MTQTIDLAFNPSQPRGFGGKWSAGGSGAPAPSAAQTSAQAKTIGVDPAVLAAMAKQLGIPQGQVVALVQQGRAQSAKKTAAGGSKSSAKKASSAAATAAKKAAAAKTSAQKKAAAAQASAVKKAQAAQTSAEKKTATAQLKAANAQVAAANKATSSAKTAASHAATVSVASNTPATKSSTAKATAINGLPAAQKALLVGSTPPSGFKWANGSLVPTATNLSGGNVGIDLSTQSDILPDMAAVKMAASKLSKLPAPLRKVAAVRLAARAKELGATLNLSVPMNLRADARDKAKAQGATFDDTTSYPTQTRPLFDKAVQAVGRGGADHDRIRKYLIDRAKTMGWTDGIPDNWSADGSLKGTS